MSGSCDEECHREVGEETYMGKLPWWLSDLRLMERRV